jgi:hypothetical protein
MVYTALCVMLLMRAASIILGQVGGSWALEISKFWAPNDTHLSARCHFTGPKKLSISRAQPPPTYPRNGCWIHIHRPRCFGIQTTVTKYVPLCVRESCLAENQHLLARLEDTNSMLQARVVHPELYPPDPDPVFQVIPDPDPTLTLGQRPLLIDIY